LFGKLKIKKQKEKQVNTTKNYSLEEIQAIYQQITQNQEVVNLLNAVFHPLVLTLPNRQVVFANKSFENYLQVKHQDILGQYLGKILGCVNPQELDACCGETLYCAYCGANKTFQALEQEDQYSTECHILSKRDSTIDSFDLKIDGKKIYIKGISLYLLNITDIKNKLRRLALRNYIIYKSIDSISAINLSIDFAKEKCKNKYLDNANLEIKKIVNNLKKYRIIAEAEENKITPNLSFFSSLGILNKTINKLGKLLEEDIERIVVTDESEDVEFWSDFDLLEMILESMLINALHYSREKVLCGTKEVEERIIFWVENKGRLEEEVEARIFKPFISEQGLVTGVGTYLIKLLGEGILKGKAWLETDKKQEKIVFYFSLPKLQEDE
jgi:hypothetical protein